jgi:transposase
MLPQHAPTPQPAGPTIPAGPPTRIGVGIDTARYGHYAAFLRADLQPAADELAFVETAAGYAQLRQRLDRIAQRHGAVHFVIRLDAAGQYADNLLHFLHGLRTSPADAGGSPAPLANATFAISCGDPQRNKNYRAALFGSKKSDAVEARAGARYAISERPAHTPSLTPELRTLRQVAGRLQATVRQRTRLINQFHQLLTLAFPELALLVKDIAVGWILELVQRYPTAQLLAAAAPTDLAAIPYLPDKHIEALLEHARASVASLHDAAITELIRDQVRQLRDVHARQKRLEKTLVQAYHALPTANLIDSIPSIGDVTAAVLTANIVDIDRFATPNKLVAYFGVMPMEMSSGVERDGQARGPRRYIMSKRGNDLVRRYLWMASLSAVRFNPAARALFRRVVAKHPQQKAIALGHVMRKLLHLVFAIWKSGKPFDPQHYPWQTPNHVPATSSDNTLSLEPESAPASDNAMSVNEQAAGHKHSAEPARKVVTATCVPTVVAEDTVGDHSAIDFAHLKKQLPLARVFDHLGLSARLARGSGPQRRCACPIHRADGRGRTMSVNLDANVFQCFESKCGAKGDVIDLWAALHHQSLREAALDLVRTFHLEPVPQHGTEKRKG